jgi:hypothetical protein
VRRFAYSTRPARTTVVTEAKIVVGEYRVGGIAGDTGTGLAHGDPLTAASLARPAQIVDVGRNWAGHTPRPKIRERETIAQDPSCERRAVATADDLASALPGR